MSILIHGLVLDHLPQEFRDDYWRTTHTDESSMNLQPWVLPEATTRAEAPERPVQHFEVIERPHEPPVQPRCDTPEPSSVLLMAVALAALWRWRT